MDKEQYLKMAKAEVALRHAGNSKEFFKELDNMLSAHMEVYPNNPFPKLTDLQRKYHRLLKNATGLSSLKEAMMMGFAEDPTGFPLVIILDDKGISRLHRNTDLGKPKRSSDHIQEFKNWVNGYMGAGMKFKMDERVQVFRTKAIQTVELMKSDQNIDRAQAIEIMKEIPELLKYVQDIDTQLSEINS